jgi:type IV pilus assembly protein PilC
MKLAQRLTFMSRPPWLRATLIAAGVVGSVWMLVRAASKFRDFFASLHANLPLPTRILLEVAGFGATWWFAFFPASVVAGLVIATRWSKR